MFSALSADSLLSRVRNALVMLCAALGLIVSMGAQAEAFISVKHQVAGEIMVADGGWADNCVASSTCSVTDNNPTQDSVPVPHHHHFANCMQMGSISENVTVTCPSTVSARLARPGNGPQLKQTEPSGIEQPPRG